MQKITPFLWFNDNAEEALDFYMLVFKEAKAGKIVRLGDVPGQPGTLLTATLELFGQRFTLLNGGPKFKFNESISFVVNCHSQQEVDYYWEKLTADGGQESMCGWLKDKFGLSWQIVPTALPKLLADEDRVKAGRVMQAMLQMRKLHVPTLEKAYTGEPETAA
jgi:predicted 3-demethylubiquinone-9 3-methyltransferase (glyoxalase superfamily)